MLHLRTRQHLCLAGDLSANQNVPPSEKCSSASCGGETRRARGSRAQSRTLVIILPFVRQARSLGEKTKVANEELGTSSVDYLKGIKVLRAAGLPMLGGYDVHAYYRDASVRAHFWAAGQDARDPNDKYKIAGKIPILPKLQKTIVIFPGFTEFCEKYSKEVLRFHEWGYNVLVIDWPGQGQSGHFGWHPLAVHCDDFDHHIGAMDAVIEKAQRDPKESNNQLITKVKEEEGWE